MKRREFIGDREGACIVARRPRKTGVPPSEMTSSWSATGQERSALGGHTSHGLADNLRIVRFGEEQTALWYLNLLRSNMA
jgi:hypothetical protein